jgi:hypothetical protein
MELDLKFPPFPELAMQVSEACKPSNGSNPCTTLSGRSIDFKEWADGRLLATKEELPSLYDIATGLSRMPRFCGQTDRFYSVAEHSMWVATVAEQISVDLPNRDANTIIKSGLLHDCAEAIMADVPKPLKDVLEQVNHNSCAHYKTIEDRILRSFLGAYVGPGHLGCASIIKTADRMAYLTEVRDLRGGPDYPFLPRFKIDPIGT